MKLRIKGNSIRLRLLRSEVERFAADGRISDEVIFANARLMYALALSDNSDSVTATFEDGTIEIAVPAHLAKHWSSGEQVGIESSQQFGDGEPLAILIEKDFACLDRPDDPDRHDAFPNPNSDCSS